LHITFLLLLFYYALKENDNGFGKSSRQCMLPSKFIGPKCGSTFCDMGEGGKKKIKLITRQFGKDHSPAFLSHSTSPHTHVQSTPKLVHNKQMKEAIHGYCLGKGHALQN
jgi:hypothetical protein